MKSRDPKKAPKQISISIFPFFPATTKQISISIFSFFIQPPVVWRHTADPCHSHGIVCGSPISRISRDKIRCNTAPEKQDYSPYVSLITPTGILPTEDFKLHTFLFLTAETTSKKKLKPVTCWHGTKENMQRVSPRKGKRRQEKSYKIPHRKRLKKFMKNRNNPTASLYSVSMFCKQNLCSASRTFHLWLFFGTAMSQKSNRE